ncbi:MAG: hypothetical protein ABIA04_01570 [Pseudomonadota bacterium]
MNNYFSFLKSRHPLHGILPEAQINDLRYSRFEQEDYLDLNDTEEFQYKYYDEEQGKVLTGDYDDCMKYKLSKMGIFEKPISTKCRNFCKSFKHSYKKVAFIKLFIAKNNFNKREIMLIWSTWRGWNALRFNNRC